MTFNLAVDPVTDQLYAGVSSYRDSHEEDFVAVMNLKTRRMIARIGQSSASDPVGLAVDSTHNIVHSLRRDSVTVIDGSTHRAKDSIILTPTSGHYSGPVVDPGTDKLFILRNDDLQSFPYPSQLVEIDLHSKKAESAVRIGVAALKLSIDPQRHVPYVSTFYEVEVLSEGSTPSAS